MGYFPYTVVTAIYCVHEVKLAITEVGMMKRHALTLCFYSGSSINQHCPTYTLQPRSALQG